MPECHVLYNERLTTGCERSFGHFNNIKMTYHTKRSHITITYRLSFNYLIYQMVFSTYMFSDYCKTVIYNWNREFLTNNLYQMCQKLQKFRDTLCKFRVPGYRIDIKRGRYDGTPRDQRFCNLFNTSTVENKNHTLLVCPVFIELLQKFTKNLSKFCNYEKKEFYDVWHFKLQNYKPD